MDDQGIAQIVANWVPGPLLALGVLAIVRREIGRIEKFQDEMRTGLQMIKDKLLEQAMLSRDFITIKSHGESTTRIYEEMRKAQEDTRERLLKLELSHAKKKREDVDDDR